MSSASWIVRESGAMRRREAAGRDDRRRVPELGLQALDHAVDEPHVAVDDARLHRVHGVAPDDARRLGDLDARAASAARVKRASALIWRPGARTPPRYSPLGVTQSKVVAVPKSTTMTPPLAFS